MTLFHEVIRKPPEALDQHQPGISLGPKQQSVSPLLDFYLVTLQFNLLGNPHGLAISTLENFRSLYPSASSVYMTGNTTSSACQWLCQSSFLARLQRLDGVR